MTPDGTARTTTERDVAAIWCEVLAVNHVPVDQGFVALGGDSMAAMLAANRIADVFGVEVPQHELLDNEMTVQRLAAAVDRGVFFSFDQDDELERARTR
ncbi:MAG TPA: phosphopantetheine-binding protein [Vicinamibacterales bacterium]|nr:phosphopantetheine-binding protein [Vicinamibacterales bacterium]